MLRRVSTLIVVGLLWVTPAQAAISLVAKCGDPSGSPSCGAGINTSGATLLVAVNGTNSAACPTNGTEGNWVSITNGLVDHAAVTDNQPLTYYSIDRLMSPEARAEWLPPDLRPLD